MTTVLSKRMSDLVVAVGRLSERRGYPPSLEELAVELGVHTSRAHALVRAAEARGAIVRTPRIPRSLRVAAPTCSGRTSRRTAR